MNYSFLGDPREQSWSVDSVTIYDFKKKYRNPVNGICDGLILDLQRCLCLMTHHGSGFNCLESPIYSKNGKNFCKKCIENEGYDKNR